MTSPYVVKVCKRKHIRFRTLLQPGQPPGSPFTPKERGKGGAFLTDCLLKPTKARFSKFDTKGNIKKGVKAPLTPTP